MENIEEVARKNTEKYNPNNSGLDREESCIASFIDGVNWWRKEFLNSVWHDAEETPNMAKHLIVETLRNSEKKTYDYWTWGNDPNPFDHNEAWWYHRFCHHFTRWCYLSDLLPKEENKNN